MSMAFVSTAICPLVQFQVHLGAQDMRGISACHGVGSSGSLASACAACAARAGGPGASRATPSGRPGFLP